MSNQKIEIAKVFHGAHFRWSQPGCGFGELYISVDDCGRIHVDNECMSREWVRAALHAFADYIADTAILEDEKC